MKIVKIERAYIEYSLTLHKNFMRFSHGKLFKV